MHLLYAHVYASRLDFAPDCTRAWVQSEVIQTVFHNVKKKGKMIRRGHVINIKV